MSEDNNDDEIGKALNLTSINAIKSQLDDKLQDMENDVNGAKHNIKDLISKGTDSLDDLIEIARSSQHPRAFEVVANLLNTLVSANKDLAAIAIKTGETNKINDNRQIHNNFNFNGSAADLLKLIKNPSIIDIEENDENE